MLQYAQDIQIKEGKAMKKIVDTSKTLEKVSGELVRVALGATHTYEFVGARPPMGEHVVLKIFDRAGKMLSSCMIVNLQPGKLQLRGLKRIGKAYGMNLSHCFYLANKYCKGFNEKVYGYRYCASDKAGCPLAVIFYRLKMKKKK